MNGITTIGEKNEVTLFLSNDERRSCVDVYYCTSMVLYWCVLGVASSSGSWTCCRKTGLDYLALTDLCPRSCYYDGQHVVR